MIEYDKYIIGQVIRRERKARSLSQEVFSGLAGMARSHLSTLELPPHELVLMIECETKKKQQNCGAPH